MRDFRRWILALAVLALCVAGANAQISGGGGSSNFTCTAANAAVTPLIRSEGITEQVGDIVLNCTGGSPTQVPPGAVIPAVNITIFLNTQVTSRLLGNGGVTNASEAVLLIDEPNSGLSGYGPSVPFIYCPTPASGCVAYNGTVNGNSNVPVTAPGGSVQASNIFQGVVGNDGKSLTFNGIPVLPPVSANTTRVFRITNIRANATAISAGPNTPGNVQALISVSNPAFMPLTNSQLVVGYVQPGLTASTQNFGNTGSLSSSGTSFNQCSSTGNSGNGAPAAILRYHSNFAQAFKTRVLATVSTSGQDGGSVIQNVPGSSNNSISESGMVFNGKPLANEGGVGSSVLGSTSGAVAGLADYGTRFQAIFNNVPAGVSILVSTANVVNITQNNGVIVTNPGPQNTSTSFAQLIVSSTAPENNNSAPILSATGSNGGATNPVTYVSLTPTSGSSSVTAVWEVINSNTSTSQNFDFGVYLAYSANVANNQPATGPISVNMSYAPIPPQSAPNTGTVLASSSATIPRFIDLGTGDNKTIATINICQTNLLFPYLTTVTGFDSGIAISNTTLDPFGTGAQAGACTLNWYGNNNGGTTNTPIPASTTATTGAPVINAGTTWTADVAATNMAGVGFTGYMIAQCNFQFAHGYAAVTDIGSRNILTAYLALVLNGARGGLDTAAKETLTH